METVTLHIFGMACGGCANTIANALQALEGVLAADVSHIEGTAAITFDPARVQPEKLKAAVEASGYKVAP